MKQTQIVIDVETDENHVPENIVWHAPDGGIESMPTKAIMLSVWDDDEREAMRLDLWTKEMELHKMKMFFHQVLISMADSYERATDEPDVAKKMIEFAETFAFLAKIKDI